MSIEEILTGLIVQRLQMASTTPVVIETLPTGITKQDLTIEQWREYDFGGRTYRITAPTALYLRDGGTTHRVLGSDGVVHCVPAPGTGDCVLRWQNKDPLNPVGF